MGFWQRTCIVLLCVTLAYANKDAVKTERRKANKNTIYPYSMFDSLYLLDSKRIKNKPIKDVYEEAMKQQNNIGRATIKAFWLSSIMPYARANRLTYSSQLKRTKKDYEEKLYR